MYSDNDLERWGNLFAKHEIFARSHMRFEQFMAFSDEFKRDVLAAFLNKNQEHYSHG